MARGKTAQLEEIANEVRGRKDLPLYAYRTENSYHAVIGEGSPDAEVMFIGEAPGRQEALKGRPFVGAAGRMLDSLLASIGLGREEVYITNILKDRPPENRAPQSKEIKEYTPYLRRQIEVIRPRVIVTLGRFAMEFILAEFGMPELGGKISELHGRPLKAEAPFGVVTVVPMFHPAVVLYRREQKEVLTEDFQVLRQFTAEKKAKA